MKKELNKKWIKYDWSCDLIFIEIIFYQKVLSKIMKNLRVNYVLVAYFERKSNLVCQINCQGRYLHETMTLCIYTIRNLTFLKCVTSLLLFS